jgi:hypothetical protein
MSEAIVVTGQNNVALQMGGIGLGANMFKARPSMLEVVHKSSRQPNVKPGEFRVLATNEHLGPSIRAVLLAVPQLQREWFFDPKVFTKENKYCFSLDGIQSHPHASNAPAQFCKTCPKGDINWVTWRKTKNPADLPPCGAYWHLLLADRNTQTPYYLNAKGRSAAPFQQAMEQQMAGLLAKLFANVKAENKKRGYTLVNLQDTPNGPVYQAFRPTPGFVLPEGLKEQLPQEPMPNIFDISFDINIISKDGGSYQMEFTKFALMKPEDKAEFGQLYLDIVQQKVDLTAEPNEEAEAEAEVSEPAASTQGQPQGEVLPPITI